MDKRIAPVSLALELILGDHTLQQAWWEGELFGGAGQGYGKALGLTLGTGLGSCLYVDGEITNAGLNVLPFKYGITEKYLSTRWFVNAFQQHTGKEVSGVKELTDMYAHKK